MLSTLLLCSILLGADPDPPNSTEAKADVPAKPLLQIKAGRNNTRIRFEGNDSATWIITSEFGIDHAIVTRLAEEWPEKVIVKAKLKGLEFFSAANEDVTVRWSVSTSAQMTLRSIWKGDKETTIAANSPYFTDVKKVVDGKEGYFEVPLPAKLFEGNPKDIRLDWIDFYRK